MWPFSGQYAGQVQEAGACRQYLCGGFTLLSPEARTDFLKPGLGAVAISGKIGHKKQVEMGQVIGQVFCRENQVGGEPAIGHGLQALCIGYRLCGRDRLADRADSTDTRGVHQGIAWVFTVQNLFVTAE